MAVDNGDARFSGYEPMLIHILASGAKTVENFSENARSQLRILMKFGA